MNGFLRKDYKRKQRFNVVHKVASLQEGYVPLELNQQQVDDVVKGYFVDASQRSLSTHLILSMTKFRIPKFTLHSILGQNSEIFLCPDPYKNYRISKKALGVLA